MPATESRLIPFAQYLRMSTEHQQYSLANQAATNLVYAEQHHFEIVRTYSDAARSGIYLKHREGLRQLLQDSVSGTCEFKAILVYDVSRWGRFQDSDESAHYEFLCKAAGVPVYYCAEGFDGVEARFVNILKSLKRTMAGEYSRELSVKVYEAQKRIAQMGYKNGGPPGYGLRRLAVDAQLQPKRLLASGERKSFPTDRVVLTPGPPQEVAIGEFSPSRSVIFVDSDHRFC
jgi:DNA invertase Pin-like site-specific DNA recombinase